MQSACVNRNRAGAVPEFTASDCGPLRDQKALPSTITLATADLLRRCVRCCSRRCRRPRVCTTRSTSATRGGVAMVADIKGRRSHSIVADGLTALEHLEHRGAARREPNSGDGAGILLQFRSNCCARSSTSSRPRRPRTAPTPSLPVSASCRRIPSNVPGRRNELRRSPQTRGSTSSAGVPFRSILGRRDRRDRAGLYASHGAVLRRRARTQRRRASGLALDRLVYPVRKRLATSRPTSRPPAPACTSRRCHREPSPTKACSPRCSCSRYFPDLRDERCASAIAIVHSRFSTNTFPSWPLAHPFRFVAHNGEINTVRGRRNGARPRGHAHQRPHPR